MPVKSIFDPEHLYFVTTSAIGHLPLFESDSAKRLIVDCLHFLRTTGRMKLFAFVVMPNHVHVIGCFSARYTLADMLRDFKRYTARQVIAELKARENLKLLASLRSLNTDRRQEYKVWEDGYDSRDLLSPKMLQQKMDYVHLNPCQPQWKLVEDPVDYLWSSARFYMADLPAIVPVDDVRESLS